MANRYWVGGTANWDGTAGSKWSDTSGGSGGFSVPTTADDVFFTNLSTGTCTISTGNTGAKSITCTGFTGTLAGSAAITVAGGITLVAGMTFTYSGTLTITGTGTITSAGKITTNNASITVNGVGITVTLADTIGIITLTLTAGTLDANNQNVNIGVGGFVSSNSNTRTLTMGSGTWSISAGTAWNTATTTGLTFSGSSSTINITNILPTFAGGGLTYGTVNFTATGLLGATITGANTFSTLSFASLAATGIATATISANQTITTSFSVQSGATNPTRRLFVRSDVQGTARTITSASNTIFGVDFRDITGAGAASWSDSGRTGYWGDCKGNSGITFATGQTAYWNLAGAQNWSATGWALTSTGTPAAANFPLAQDTATFTNAGSVTGQITVNASWNIGTVDMSNRTSAMFLQINGAMIVYGNWLNGTGLTMGSSDTLTFAGRNTQSITSAGIAFTPQTIINSVGGTVQLVDTLTLNLNNLIVTAGTFTTNNQTLNLIGFSSSNSNTRTINLGTSTINLSGTGTVWTCATVTGLTLNATSSTIKLTDTSTSARTLIMGTGLAYGTINIGGATGISTTTIDATSNTINTLSSSKTVAHTILFTTSVSIANWTVTGTAGNIVTINSSVAGTQRPITYTGSGTVSMDYMSIKDINFSYTLGAANPYLVYAGANSTNGGNNAGIAFIASTSKAYRLTTGTSWTTPADWNNASNTIHMIGAGGGGATSAVSGNNRAAGGGGGGGGYTVLTNQTLSGAIPYTIGTSAGNANGGSTTFNTTNTAGGGSVGTATTTPTSTGGAGGTGTYAGGTGGAGAFGTAASTGYGSGGGGGAGGPNGIGGNGGTGFGAINAPQLAGGGGGGNGGGSNGTAGSSALGGNGGNNFSGTGGAIGTSGSGTAGTFGGGGAGGSNTTTGGAGGSGIDIANTIGGGGGKGGSTTVLAGITNTGLYGGGGTGGTASTTGSTFAGGAGSQGVIFIVYTPGAVAAANGNFFFLYNNVLQQRHRFWPQFKFFAYQWQQNKPN